MNTAGSQQPTAAALLLEPQPADAAYVVQRTANAAMPISALCHKPHTRTQAAAKAATASKLECTSTATLQLSQQQSRSKLSCSAAPALAPCTVSAD